MPADGKLRLDLLDVHGERLSERVDISLRHQTLSESRRVSVGAAKRIVITQLNSVPQGLYRLEVDPPSYLPVSQFVNIAAEGFTNLEITFPVDPMKVKGVIFPKYDELPDDLRKLLEASQHVFSFDGVKGRELYNALDDLRRAGLLNLFKEAANTPLINGKTVFPYVQELKELRGDRFFAVVPKELREETKHSVAEGLFHEASKLLHHPPAAFEPAGSFKTEDRYGNLQLSFFMKGDDCVVDMDIDDAAGLAHVFQVLRNALTDRPTHPYDIHQILIAYQRLDPGYSFVV